VKKLRDAPKDKQVIAITPHSAHLVEWDREFGNWWSLTAGKALDADVALHWVTPAEWLRFWTKEIL